MGDCRGTGAAYQRPVAAPRRTRGRRAWRALRPVAQPVLAGLAGAVHAAVDLAVALHAVADDLAVAVRAARGEGVDGAFEGVEGVPLARHLHLEGLVVVVAADLADRHGSSSPPRPGARPRAPLSDWPGPSGSRRDANQSASPKAEGDVAERTAAPAAGRAVNQGLRPLRRILGG